MAASRLFIQLAVVATMAYYCVDGANVLDTVEFKLYTRGNRMDHDVIFSKQHEKPSRYLDLGRPLKIIIHGFLSSSKNSWVIKMKDELLKKENVNVVTVDWSQLFGAYSYDKGVQNVANVGKMLGQWLSLQSTKGLSLEKVHIIGHSLGGQMAGYVGNFLGSMKIGRITALDPAKPQFEGQTKNHVINRKDAKFVDAIHTDAGPFNGLSGYGMMEPAGNVDFYPNGGIKQPGCGDNVVVKVLKKTGIGKNKRTKRGKSKSVSCNHSRSILLFTDSINAKCEFKSQGCASFEKFLQSQCPSNGVYGFMGYYADTTKASGKHYLVTNAQAPFC